MRRFRRRIQAMTCADPPYPDPRTLDRIPWDRSGEALTLTIGPWRIAVQGLDPETEGGLAVRWGGFSSPGLPDRPDLQLFCVDRTAGENLGLGTWQPGEVYRLEGALVAGRPVIRSYNFCMTTEGGGDGNWKLVLGGAPEEPLERTVENAVRCLVSRLALRAGGFALHGAGVRRSGETWIYAGTSGAGKSTAVSLTAPCESLGDDFALAIPHDGRWATCAVPFDNSERAPDRPITGLLPLGAILRLFQAGAGEAVQVQAPPSVLRTASLLTTVMLPGLFVDLVDAEIENAGCFAAEGQFGHLKFHKEQSFVEQVRLFVSRERGGSEG